MSELHQGSALSPWEEFAGDPAAYVAASRLVPCFDGKLPPDLCRRLAALQRLRPRINELICATYRLAPVGPAVACSDADRAIALAAPDRLAELARRAGAIFWAEAIANLILARQVATLRERLGEEIHRLALSHRDLAGPPRSIEPIAEAVARIARDGWLCLAAWCQAQSEAVGTRVLLKLEPSEGIDRPPESPFAELGPDIVRRAAS